MIENKELLDFMDKNLAWAGIASISGFVHYMYKYSKWASFSFTKLVVNIIVAWYVGYLGQKLGLSEVYISICGYSAFPILDMIETKWPIIFREILLKK